MSRPTTRVLEVGGDNVRRRDLLKRLAHRTSALVREGCILVIVHGGGKDVAKLLAAAAALEGGVARVRIGSYTSLASGQATEVVAG